MLKIQNSKTKLTALKEKAMDKLFGPKEDFSYDPPKK